VREFNGHTMHKDQIDDPGHAFILGHILERERRGNA